MTSNMPDFEVANEAFSDGDIAKLEQLSQSSEFPHGCDDMLTRQWLSTAINSQNADAVAWVLSKEPEVNYVDTEGSTALTWAVQIEKDSQFFHKIGLDGGIETLSEAEAERLTIRMIDLLVEAGADINLGGTLGETVLHAAAMWSSPAIVRHLLHRGADPMIWDHEYDPKQPAYYAQFKKRPQVYEILRAAMDKANGKAE